jgi:hypothetical protein
MSSGTTRPCGGTTMWTGSDTTRDGAGLWARPAPLRTQEVVVTAITLAQATTIVEATELGLAR